MRTPPWPRPMPPVLPGEEPEMRSRLAAAARAPLDMGEMGVWPEMREESEVMPVGEVMEALRAALGEVVGGRGPTVVVVPVVVMVPSIVGDG